MFRRGRAALAAVLLSVSGMAGVVTSPPAAHAATASGYLMVDGAGRVYPFGAAPFCGHSSMVFGDRATDVEITPASTRRPAPSRMWGPGGSTNGDARHHFVSVPPGTCYVSVEPIDDAYIWGLGVADQRCTADCS